MRDNKIEENKSSEHFSAFKSGLADGIPIALGYLAVSFSFGILAVKDGLLIWQSVLISLTNLTSAGQVAGISIMTMSGGLFEMFLSQLVINIRYSLMSVALTQKTDSSFSIPARLLLSFGITDEIFGVASSAPRTFSRRQFSIVISSFSEKKSSSSALRSGERLTFSRMTFFNSSLFMIIIKIKVHTTFLANIINNGCHYLPAFLVGILSIIPYSTASRDVIQ